MATHLEGPKTFQRALPARVADSSTLAASNLASCPNRNPPQLLRALRTSAKAAGKTPPPVIWTWRSHSAIIDRLSNIDTRIPTQQQSGQCHRASFEKRTGYFHIGSSTSPNSQGGDFRLEFSDFVLQFPPADTSSEAQYACSIDYLRVVTLTGRRKIGFNVFHDAFGSQM
jgi:hypothetical protein